MNIRDATWTVLVELREYGGIIERDVVDNLITLWLTSNSDDMLLLLHEEYSNVIPWIPDNGVAYENMPTRYMFTLMHLKFDGLTWFRLLPDSYKSPSLRMNDAKKVPKNDGELTSVFIHLFVSGEPNEECVVFPVVGKDVFHDEPSENIQSGDLCWLSFRKAPIPTHTESHDEIHRWSPRKERMFYTQYTPIWRVLP